jgi:hypothetical protein
MTDGAGCYSSTHLFYFLAYSHILTGIRVVAHYVSQAGQGKSPLDAHFAYMSQHITRAVLAGKSKTDIIDAESGVAAMQYGGGMSGSKALLAIVCRDR